MTCEKLDTEISRLRAAVEFDGKKFVGTIENISDLVTFESDNTYDLEREFHAAVDAYIKFRKSAGKNHRLNP